jgi:hypothetical protein
VVAVAAKQQVPNNIETIINSFISHAPRYVWHTKRSHSKFNHRLRIPEVEYPFHEGTITVTQCGRICVGTKKINLSQVVDAQSKLTTVRELR